MKKLIHVSCTSAHKFPEKPLYIMVRGKKYQVSSVLSTAKIQTIDPPFETQFYYKVELNNGEIVEIEYHEKKREWYLIATSFEF